MLKCIIVDDEQYSINVLSKYIEHIPEIIITNVFTNPLEALMFFSSAEPTDLLFIDIEMPEISGLELAQTIRGKTEKLIFTTAHSKFAFNAYEATADAFLLKPYSFEKFATAVSRLFKGQFNYRDLENGHDEFFMIKNKADQTEVINVRFNDVIAFQRVKNYITIHLLNNKKLTTYLTFEDILPLLKTRNDFIQLHRGYIISISYIQHIKGYNVEMFNQMTFSVANIYKGIFSAFVNDNLLKTSRKQ